MYWGLAWTSIAGTSNFYEPVTLLPGDYWLVIYGDSGDNNNDLLWEFGSESPINGLTATVFSLEFPQLEYFPLGNSRQVALQICGLPQEPFAVPGINRLGLLLLAMLLLAVAVLFIMRVGKVRMDAA